MSGHKAVEIKRFGLTQVYMPEDESTAVAIIVFIHGLFGHPQRTWTGHQEPARSICSSSDQNSNASSSQPKRNGGAFATQRVSMSTKCSEQASEVSQDTLIGCVSSSRSQTNCASTMETSQILGLQPGEVFWPETILPSVLPETRIFTWGYDADVDAFNTSVGHNNVEQHANDLLVDIANLLERLDDLARPIIFVVHSLGGIVVKEALNIASHSEIERLKGVASTTYGISFLGTPHRGSGSATIGKHAYRIARLATKRPNIKLLRSLEKNSDTLKGISNRFRSTQQKWNIKISSFYEDREVRKFIVFHSLIVDNESAQIGHPGEEVSSIPKNHRDMTKFTSPDEVGFERVSSQLRRWVQEIENSEESGDWDEDLETCLSSLENSQTRARYMNVASSYDGTFQWLFDHDIVPFVNWLEEDQKVIGPSRPIFWINGKPGSGKSTLMKFAMRDQRTQDCLEMSSRSKWIVLGFFFHDRGSHIQKSIDGMLQAVLHQLLSQVPSLLSLINRGVYAELVMKQRKSNPDWIFESLCAAWASVTKQRKEQLHVCIFLDALDEHDGDNDLLAKFIYQLLSSADGKIVRIKICVASRTWNIFGEHFGTCPQFAIHEHTAGDIQAYTSERLSAPVMSLGNEARLTLSPKIERLSSQVTTKARGVFIWVRIVMDELVKGIRDGTALSRLEEKVSKMPEELGDLYRHTLRRIEPDYAEEAYIMLQITLCGLEPLPLETFMKCVSFAKWREVHEASEEEMIRQLTSRSGGLLEVIVERSRKKRERDNEGLEVEQTVGGPTTVSESDVSFRGRDYEHHSTVDRHLVYESEYTASVESNRDENDILSHISVQFIHQTVKDFIAENRKDLGLHLSNNMFRSDSGHLYLLDCATHFGRTSWARDISRSMFEYAFLAESDGISDMTRFHELFIPMIDDFNYRPEGLNVPKIQGWFTQELPQYIFSLTRLSHHAQFLALAVAADLKSLVPFMFWNFFQYGTEDGYEALLLMAATGKRLSSSSASRESMLKLLLEEFPFYIDDGIDGLELEDAHNLYTRLGSTLKSRTTLSWVLRVELQKYITKDEALSLARFLLEHGASPNVSAIPDTCCPDQTSLLYNCIRHYNIEAVKLLLLYEADTSVIDYQLMFNLGLMEGSRDSSGEETSETMSGVLREYGIETKWSKLPIDQISIPARLVVMGGYPIEIGCSKIGKLLRTAHNLPLHGT